jgi:DNA-binding MarR family transcriptional regulator
MKPLPSPQQVGRAGGAFELERFLPYRLSVLANLASRALARLYGARFGLSVAEWRVIAHLARAVTASANEVAARAAMDKVQVSRAVARLRAKELVERATDAADRRRSALRLTRRGQATHDAIVPLARGLEAQMLAGLASTDVAQLDRLLAALIARAGELDGDAAPTPGNRERTVPYS